MYSSIFKPPLPENHKIIHWSQLFGTSVALSLANAALNLSKPMLMIAPDSLYASQLMEALAFFSDPQQKIIYFPDWETLPYDHFSPHQDIISDRLGTLYQLPSLRNVIVVATVQTLMQRLPPQTYLDQTSFLLQVGDVLNLDVLKTRLVSAGYRHSSEVKEHGEYAIRGSVIDLYPMGSKVPYRIDLFDNEVDSIRIFSRDTQRTLDKINKVQLLPAREFPLNDAAIDLFRQAWRNHFSGNPLASPLYQDVSEGIAFPGIEYYLPLFFQETATIFNYLSQDTLIIQLENTKEKTEKFYEEILDRYEQGRHDILRPLLSPETLFIRPQELYEALNHYSRVILDPTRKTKTTIFNTEHAPDLEINHKLSVPLKACEEFAKFYQGRILFCAESTGRREILMQQLAKIGIHPQSYRSWHSFLADDRQHGITVGLLENGFCLQDENICLITERELYGKKVMQRRLRKKAVTDPNAIIRDLTELKIEDPVVHIDHGVGRYLGLKTLEIGSSVGEFLMLEYEGGDKLYVPVSALHLISRYTGASDMEVHIHRLGTPQWQKVKKRAAEKIKDVAAELLELYAKRAANPKEPYVLPETYEAFAEKFPFEETPDQMNAINHVVNDLISTKPMDRVICGDVGFGKTEVAMRAAFIAVHNNKQVIMLVPTTLLAQQHLQNFQDRFSDTAVAIEMLSRFRTAKEQKTILEKLSTGKIDIVIGTHKLLQSNIQFKELGLVIIDEEHRFGVKQKEKLKQLRAKVDILTLTATPIPRTLNMALAGIRDLSVIATPPAKRLSVNTFVHEYKDYIVQEAIQREIMRGGQVYFLHNDVATIARKAEELKNLAKEARVAFAHGQMHERELERIMSQFYHRQFNVLVCSTIIESGIDIPTANTIIINRADKFGIAQLHQLRGRVGRSHHQAYAYLLVPEKTHLTKDATKRLEAIASLHDLGIGFTLATHDLEIRGAGELLGEEQSGDIHEMGFTLYMDLLSRAVDALQHGETMDLELSSKNAIDIDLNLPALIPEDYLSDVQLRLQLYKRIANADSMTALDNIQIEMIDRFGLLQTPIKTLFHIAELKIMATPLGIIKIEAGQSQGRLEFGEKTNVRPEKIIHLIQNKSQIFKLDGPTKLKFKLPTHHLDERYQLVKDILSELR